MIATVVALAVAPAGASAAACPSGLPYANAVLATSGLAGYWRLDDASTSATPACDALGANPGTYNSTGVTPGPAGPLAGDSDRSASFDGVTGYVNVPNALAFNFGDTFSVEAWIKRSSTTNTTDQFIASKGMGWALVLKSSGKLALQNNGNAITTSNTMIADMGWHHVVATKSGMATAHLYVDGVDQGGTISATTVMNNIDAIKIAANTLGALPFKGTLDEVAVYSSALSADQVTNHYRLAVAACPTAGSSYGTAISQTSGLVGYWRVGESSGTTACDSAGKNPGVYNGGFTLGRSGAIVNDPSKAVLLNGSSGWISVPGLPSLDVADAFSVEAWVKRGTLGGSANQVIASKQGSAWTLAFDTSNRLVLQSGATTIATSTSAVADTTAWHYVAATKSGGSVHLYVDDSDVTGTVTNATAANNNSVLAIGQNGASAAFLNGTVDELALYGRALSSAETSAHYLAGATPVNQVLPAISGAATEGLMLTASTGTWAGATAYAYQWRSCDSSGAGCADILGATSSTYVLVYGDVGSTLKVVVRASNGPASTTATSAQTGVVQGADPPFNTSAPTISGSAVKGQVLTASPGSWAGTSGSYTYQWQRCDAGGANCGSPIATGPTYTLVQGDVAMTLRVVVTATNAAGSTTATSAQSLVVQPSGACPNGSPYSAAVLGTAGISAYWRLDELSGTFACDALGQNSLTYTGGVTLGQAGAIIGDPDKSAMFDGVTGEVTTGGATLGSGDVFSIEAWVKHPMAGLTTQFIAAKGAGWQLVLNSNSNVVLQRNGSVIATSTTAVGADMIFHHVAATKNGTGAGSVHLYIDGVDRTPASPANLAISDNTSPVTIATNSLGASAFKGNIDEVALYSSVLSASQVASHYSLGVAPANTALPMISGTPTDGQTLSASTGTWVGATSYAYQWQRCDATGANCVDITTTLCPGSGSATLSTYKLVSCAVGKTVRVRVKASNSRGFNTVSSPVTAVVGAVVPTNTSAPTISGTASDGQTLTASTSGWDGTQTMTYAYQWRRCDSAGANCQDISGARQSTYKLVSGDVGMTVRVVVIASNVAGSGSPATSAAKGPVAGAPPANSSLPAISGLATVGETLTASTGAWDGTPPFTYTYQWRSCDSSGANCANLAGSTAASYTLVSGDFGKTLRVVVTAQNATGSAPATSPQTPVVGQSTNVCGTISTNTTWTQANSPYVMTCDVTVASAATLTIESGVVVKASATVSLNVNGSLAANGTEAAPITLTSLADSAPGQWYHLTFAVGSGTSTLKFVNVRYGGLNDIAAANGMVSIIGGTVTIEDSTISGSSVSGLVVGNGDTGSGVSLTVRRSKFENNGFTASGNHGNGLRVSNAPFVIEDSAFWSNANDGITVTLDPTYTQGAGQITGTSIWHNGRGVNVSAGGVPSLGPDGHVAGKLGNAIYDNGTFGLTPQESWQQLVSTTSLAMDWTGSYWGPVTFIACPRGSQNGQLSYGAPDPNPGASGKVPRGPIEHDADFFADLPLHACGNDHVLANPPANEMPDIHFKPPPPSFGGLPLEQTFGCLPCALELADVASSLDRPAFNPLTYTGQPVNTASGSLTETTTDLHLTGPGIPFSWTRTYNSRDTTDGGFGRGWSHPFEAKIAVVDSSTLEYRSGSGQRTRFLRVTGGTTGSASFAGKGFDGSLDRLSDNSYQLVTRDRRTFTFDSAGLLTSLKPRFGPATTLAYSAGKLVSITDSAGRQITVTWVGNVIASVSLPDGRTVHYGYTSGRLTSVQDANDKTTTMTYEASGYLASIHDAVGHYELQNVQYDDLGRVTSEQNGSGHAIAYAYSTAAPYDITRVSIPGRGDWVYRHVGYMLMSMTDPLGHTSSYSYDPMARLKTSTDGRGNTRRYGYDAAGNVIQQVAPSPLDYVTQRTFNATNDLVTEQDGRAHTTTYAYAMSANADYQDGQLQTITDREGNTTTLKYWTATSSPTPPAAVVGLLKSSTNQRAKTTTYDYDSSGNVAKITSPLGNKTTMTYDSSGRLLTRRDPRGNAVQPAAGYLTSWSYDDTDAVLTQAPPAESNSAQTTFGYYDNGLLSSSTRSDGTPRVTTFEYDSDNRLYRTTLPRGGVETRLYWPDGHLKSLQSPVGRKTSYSYDDAGQLTSLVEPNGNAAGATPGDWTWSYDYDAAGNRDSESHPDGGTREIAYDALNRPVQWTDALGHHRDVTYDANDNVRTRSDARNDTETLGYDNVDRLTSVIDERSKTWTYDYFASGERKTATTPLGNKTTWGLDDDGRTTSMVEARGNEAGGVPAQFTWSYGYDAAGNRTSVTDPLSNQLQYAYDAVNDVTRVTDQRSKQTDFAYDGMNRLATVTPPAAGASGTLATNYAYDADGNLASRTDPKGHVTSWTSDLDGLATRRVTPVGTWNQIYDANGNLKRIETPAGVATSTAGDATVFYGYDRMSRPTTVNYSDTTPDVTRSYDVAGRLQSMSDGYGSVSYTFDDANRLTDTARSGGGAGLDGTLHYAYDEASNITARTYPDASPAQTAHFDDDGRLDSITAAGSTTSFGYDTAANLTTVTLPSGNGYAETRTFDRAGRLTTVENTKAGTGLSQFTRTLDAAGNPTRVQTTRAGVDSYDHYDYDDRNRLLDVCYGVSQSASDCTGASGSIAYAYDKVSDRTQEVRSGTVANPGTIDSVYNAADQLQSTTKGAQTTSYGYDANGNQTTAGSRTFSYDLANRLISTASGSPTTSYAYDGDSRRIKSTTSNGGADLRFNWDPQAPDGIAQLAHERTSTGSLVRRYLNGPLGPVSASDGTTNSYYHHDPLGSVSDVTDGNGSAQWRYDYEPYGTQRSATNVSGTAPANKLGFNGQYQDAETGLYHLRARQYDPATSRFGSLDPVENPSSAPYDGAYAYANAQPTVLTDPLGQFGIGDIARFGANAVKAKLTTDAGVLDTLTLGGSTKLLNAAGVHPNGLFFHGGQAIGYGALIFGGEELAAAKLAGRLGLGETAWRLGGGNGASAGLCLAQAAVNGQQCSLRNLAEMFAFSGLVATGARCAAPMLGAARGAAKAAPEIKAGVAGGETAGKAFPQSVRQAALDENPSTCVFCRMETESPQVDHSIPRARGGDATIENAQTSCPHCNASKGARDYPVNPPPGYRGPWPPPWWRR